MKRIYKNKFIKFIIALLVASFISSSVVTIVEASSYESWVTDTESSTLYGGSSMSSQSSGSMSLTQAQRRPKYFEVQISRALVSLAYVFWQISRDAHMELDTIILGRVARNVTVNNFGFDLSDGNIYGTIGAIIYSLLRNFMFGVLGIYFVYMLVSFLIRGTSNSRASLKESMYNFIFVFALLYAVPIAVDYMLFFRDALLKTAIDSVMTSAHSFSLPDLFITKAEDTYKWSYALLACFAVGGSIWLAYNYVRIALQQTYLFSIFPMVAFRSFSDKGILNKWISQIFANALVPIFDSMGYMMLAFMMTKNPVDPNLEDFGASMIILIMFFTIIPGRNMLLQLFGAPIPGKGFSLLPMAMMAARLLRGGLRQATGGSGISSRNGDGEKVSSKKTITTEESTSTISPVDGNNGNNGIGGNNGNSGLGGLGGDQSSTNSQDGLGTPNPNGENGGLGSGEEGSGSYGDGLNPTPDVGENGAGYEGGSGIDIGEPTVNIDGPVETYNDEDSVDGPIAGEGGLDGYESLNETAQNTAEFEQERDQIFAEHPDLKDAYDAKQAAYDEWADAPSGSATNNAWEAYEEKQREYTDLGNKYTTPSGETWSQRESRHEQEVDASNARMSESFSSGKYNAPSGKGDFGSNDSNSSTQTNEHHASYGGSSVQNPNASEAQSRLQETRRRQTMEETRISNKFNETNTDASASYGTHTIREQVGSGIRTAGNIAGYGAMAAGAFAGVSATAISGDMNTVMAGAMVGAAPGYGVRHISGAVGERIGQGGSGSSSETDGNKPSPKKPSPKIPGPKAPNPKKPSPKKDGKSGNKLNDNDGKEQINRDKGKRKK